VVEPAMLFKVLLAQKQCSPCWIIGSTVERRAVLPAEEFCLHRRGFLHDVEKAL